VIAQNDLEAVIRAGRDRAEAEVRYLAALQEGRSTVEVLGLDPSPVEIAAFGVPSG